jgi:hypothetical protein
MLIDVPQAHLTSEFRWQTPSGPSASLVSLALQSSSSGGRLIGLDWKDAPHDVKSFIAELQTLKTVLSETNTKLILTFETALPFSITFHSIEQ